jgi:hypothetical protein
LGHFHESALAYGTVEGMVFGIVLQVRISACKGIPMAAPAWDLMVRRAGLV